MVPPLYKLPRPSHLKQLLKSVSVEYSHNTSALSNFGRDNIRKSLLGELRLSGYLHKYWNRIPTNGSGDTSTSERNVLNFKVISNTSANVLSEAVQRTRLRRRWSAALREAVKLRTQSGNQARLSGSLELAVHNGLGYREPMSELIKVSSAVLEMIDVHRASRTAVTNAQRKCPAK